MNTRSWLMGLGLGLTAMAAAACGDDQPKQAPLVITEPDQSGAADMRASQDMGQTLDQDQEEDIPTIGDLGADDGGDARQATVIKEWPLHDKAAASGLITVTREGDAWRATIDAAAGGSMAAKMNPFVYLDLDAGGQVVISDLDSLKDATWELGFKRTAIRTNSADSGPGKAQLAKLSGTTFEAVMAAPADPNEYAVDETLNEEGDLRADPIGTPFTAFNYLNLNNPTGSASWYSYEMGVSPVRGDVYIVKSADTQATFKLEILSWAGGVYTLRWQPLN